MRRIRFTIASLLVVVLFLAVGFAALREASDLWESGIFTLTLGVLLISILLAVHRIEFKRAFWLGFAVCGWIYLGLTLFPSIESRLITTKALAYLHSKLPRSNPAGLIYVDPYAAASWDVVFAKNSQPNVLHRNRGNATFEDVTSAAGFYTAAFSNIFLGTKLKASSGTSEHFVRIGHSLLALVAAFLGGLLSRHFNAGNQSPVSASVNPQA
jgi:hypothetical protein